MIQLPFLVVSQGVKYAVEHVNKEFIIKATLLPTIFTYNFTRNFLRQTTKDNLWFIFNCISVLNCNFAEYTNLVHKTDFLECLTKRVRYNMTNDSLLTTGKEEIYIHNNRSNDSQ